MGTHRYPEEFRREAVRLLRGGSKSRAALARDLGISDGTLAAWVVEFDTRDAGGLDEDERAELIRLRRELAEELNLPRFPGHGVMTDRRVRGRGATCQRTQLG